MKALLLAGGLGTRLRSVVPDAPKPLASVGGRPFLELLVRQLRHQGIRRLVLCTGYLAQQIENDLGDGSRFDVTIDYSREPEPMGTAGAIKLAERFLRDDGDFLAMNGDSFMEIDLGQLIEFHRASGGIATVAVLRMKNEMRYGTVQADARGRVSGFKEKANADAFGLVSAGIYVFNRRVLDCIPAGNASLERDVLPRLLEDGVYASEQRGAFIDIGTPEDYLRAQEIATGLYEAACRK